MAGKSVRIPVHVEPAAPPATAVPTAPAPSAPRPAPAGGPAPATGRPTWRWLDVWAWLSVAAGLLAMAGNAVGLVWIERIYGRETSVFVDQAVAQDLVDLVVVGPALVGLALAARRGSAVAHLLWPGALAFTVYNYAIYAIAIHVGPLSLLWVAVLGLATWALIGAVATLAPESRVWSPDVPQRTVGWFLVAVGAAFAGLWLAELVPAVVAGEVPRSARDLNLPANPVHVLDLTFFLPAVVAAGVLVLRHRRRGLALAPGLLLFLVLTGLPILVTPFVASARGGVATWSVLVPIGVLTLATAGLLGWLLRAVGPQRGGPA